MATGGGVENNLTDGHFEIACTICAKRHWNREAKKYCTDCKKNLCLECEQTHRDHSDGHRIIDGPGDEDVASLLTLKCDRHRDELIRNYCVDHNELLCTVCTSLDHGSCEGHKTIIESIDELSNDAYIQGVPDRLKNALENVGQVITGLDEQVAKVSQLEENYLEEIETYADKLMSKIKEMKENAKAQVIADYHDSVSKLTDRRQACVTDKDDINRRMKDINDSGARKAHLFITKKKGQALVPHVDILCTRSRNLIKARQLGFKPNWKIEDSLKYFLSLGSESENYKLSFQGAIDIKGNAATYTDIKGCCLLPDGTVLLADQSHKIVKHVNPATREVKNITNLQGEVTGITRINENEVAVCNEDLQIVSLENMSIVRTIQTNFPCRKVACHNDNIYVSDTTCIHVIDLSGNVLRVIEKNSSGQNLFSSIQDITLNKTGDRLYVADWVKGLICLDQNGQEIFHLTTQKLKIQSTCGLSMDNRGNIFVCGFMSKSVIQVTEDGRVVGRDVSQPMIDQPRQLLCDMERRRLYAAGCRPDLMIFEIL